MILTDEKAFGKGLTMTMYDRDTVKTVLTGFANDPIGFGERLFDEGNYPSPYRGSGNPFVRHEDVDEFYKKLEQLDNDLEGLEPRVVVAHFLGVFLPYTSDPNADYMLDATTVYAMIALGAAAHISVHGEDAIEVISELEPYYTIALSECIKVVGSEWQCPEAVPALQYTASLLVPNFCNGD